MGHAHGRAAASRRSTGGAGELSVVDGDVLLDTVDLDSKSPGGAGECPAERSLHALDITVVGVVDLDRIESQRGIGEAQHAHEKARLLVEIELYGRLAFAHGHKHVSIAVADLRGRG